MPQMLRVGANPRPESQVRGRAEGPLRRRRGRRPAARPAGRRRGGRTVHGQAGAVAGAAPRPPRPPHATPSGWSPAMRRIALLLLCLASAAAPSAAAPAPLPRRERESPSRASERLLAERRRTLAEMGVTWLDDRHGGRQRVRFDYALRGGGARAAPSTRTTCAAHWAWSSLSSNGSSARGRGSRGRAVAPAAVTSGLPSSSRSGPRPSPAGSGPTASAQTFCRLNSEAIEWSGGVTTAPTSWRFRHSPRSGRSLRRDSASSPHGAPRRRRRRSRTRRSPHNPAGRRRWLSCGRTRAC